MDQQHQLDSLLQEVCIYDLAHSELKLIEFSVGHQNMPKPIPHCPNSIKIVFLPSGVQIAPNQKISKTANISGALVTEIQMPILKFQFLPFITPS